MLATFLGVRILLTGASGLLGKYLLQSTPPGIEVSSVSRKHPSIAGSAQVRLCDLTDHAALEGLLRGVQPTGVIHAAAEGSVDTVESDVERFRPLNVGLPEFLAQFTASTHSRFLHVSSNAVFGGKAGDYCDFDPPDPINSYGHLKAQAESRVMAANPEAVILRPILMYGLPNPGGRVNIALRFIRELSLGRPVRALTDVVSQPLYAGDAASVAWQAFQSPVTGPLNVSGGETLSIYDFALLIAEVFNFDSNLVQATRLTDLKNLTSRPMTTTFSMRRVREELSYRPQPVRKGLQRLKEEWNRL